MMSLSKAVRNAPHAVHQCRMWARSAGRGHDAPETFLASETQVRNANKPVALPPLDELVFGQTFTPHILKCEWSRKGGWSTPSIEPFDDLRISPAATSLHYALQCFEGMKAYRRPDGEVFLFRPEVNARRMLRSASRLALPSFEPPQMVDAIKRLVWTDREWIPQERGYSMYIRPSMISLDNCLGLAPPQRALFYVMLCPVGPYHKQGFKPVKMLADTYNVRAFPGGAGEHKLGSNYGPTVAPQLAAQKEGYSQILWLGEGHTVTEGGTMNMMFYWTNTEGEREVVTAPIDGTVLPGVTRDSCLTLLREWGECRVTERPVTIYEVIQAQQEGRLHECFGTGTAAIVSLVDGINFQGVEYKIPAESNPGVAKRLCDTIMSIQYGDKVHPWSVPVSNPWADAEALLDSEVYLPTPQVHATVPSAIAGQVGGMSWRPARPSSAPAHTAAA